MWSGNLQAPINRTQYNGEQGEGWAATGSLLTGDTQSTDYLGASSVRFGRINNTNSTWIDSGSNQSQSNHLPLYALSPVFTTPVPEPASVITWTLLVTIGFVGLWRNGRCKAA